MHKTVTNYVFFLMRRSISVAMKVFLHNVNFIRNFLLYLKFFNLKGLLQFWILKFFLHGLMTGYFCHFLSNFARCFIWVLTKQIVYFKTIETISYCFDHTPSAWQLCLQYFLITSFRSISFSFFWFPLKKLCAVYTLNSVI